jgi:hypothetical protein
MPLGQKLGGGIGVPALLLLIGFARGGYIGDHPHTIAIPIAMGVISALIAVMFFGRAVVLRPDGIAYGYLFITGRPIPWTRITDITTVSTPGYKHVGRNAWRIDLHFEGGGALRLPAPYAVGKQPGASFCADYDVIRQRWHGERAHARSLARRQGTQHPHR